MGGAWVVNNSLVIELSEKMYEEGYHYITNADYSGVLIEDMRERNAHLEEMDCKYSPKVLCLRNLIRMA